MTPDLIAGAAASRCISIHRNERSTTQDAETSLVTKRSVARELLALGRPRSRAKLSMITTCFAAVYAMLHCDPLAAQTWPTRQVTIISPFQAGSTPDSVVRILA